MRRVFRIESCRGRRRSRWWRLDGSTIEASSGHLEDLSGTSLSRELDERHFLAMVEMDRLVVWRGSTLDFRLTTRRRRRPLRDICEARRWAIRNRGGRRRIAVRRLPSSARLRRPRDAASRERTANEGADPLSLPSDQADAAGGGKFSFHFESWCARPPRPSGPSPSLPTKFSSSVVSDAYHSRFQTCALRLTASRTHSQT